MERAVSELKERVKTSKTSTARKAEAYLGSSEAGKVGEFEGHLAGGISVGYLLRDDLAIGATAKYVNQRLDVYTASAFALDLGLKSFSL